MKNTTIMVLTAGLISIICLSGQARAHFGMIIPSDSMVGQQDSKVLTLTLSFSHPFEGVGMELVKPKAFGVVAAGKNQDLIGSLQQTDKLKGLRPHYSIYKFGSLALYKQYIFNRL